MSELAWVIIGSLIGSLLSIAGGILLLSNRRLAQRLANIATPFAAGALLGAAFFDLLPDALEHANAKTVSTFTVIGIVSFFLLERYIHVFHHQHRSDDSSGRHTAPLIIIGDTVHNALDGVAIAAAFLINVPTGLIASLAVAAHEVPQEVGDFGLLLRLGYGRWKVLLINIGSSLATTPVAVAVWSAGGDEAFPIGALLGLTIGFFIYIAVADLIPRLHSQRKSGFAWSDSLLLIAAVVIMAVVSNLAHNYVEQNDAEVSQQELTNISTIVHS